MQESAALKRFKEMEEISGLLDACDFFPWKEITPDLAKYVVQRDGFSLRFVPEEMITPELAWIAVKTSDEPNGAALQWVPEEMKTYEMCFAACAFGEQSTFALDYIPDHLIDYQMCLVAVMNPNQPCGCALEFVPEQFKDEALCRLAQSVNTESKKFFPANTVF